MKRNGWALMLFVIGSLLGCLTSCQKDQLSTGNGSGLSLLTYTDTLAFNEVFTTELQPTQTVKLFNISDQDVTIHSLKLAGGDQSPFKINFNGAPGSSFKDIEVAKDDSLYIFVTLQLPATNRDAPFYVTDSIEYSYGDRTDKIILNATGLNAFILQGGSINHDTTWTSKRPIVLHDNLTVARTATLHIEPGTKIYTKAGKYLNVQGRLEAIGSSDSLGAILMTGARLDPPYNKMPGSWGGIVLGSESNNNILKYVQIQNAVTAITDTAKLVASFDVKNLLQQSFEMEGCVISQSAREALKLRHSSATLINCLIYNSGASAINAVGGNYTFNYLTIAGYSNDFIYHTEPLLYLADHHEDQTSDPLTITCNNSIVTGDNLSLEELFLDSQNDNFQISFNHCLLKLTDLPSIAVFNDCLFNVDPAFNLIDNRRASYDFRVMAGSPAIGTAVPIAGITKDILSNQRDPNNPTIGAFEFKELETL